VSLKSFGTKKPSAQDAAAATPATVRKDSRVPMTVRLEQSQWRRVKELALDERVSVQELALRGFSRLLEDKGLDPL
jgi:hypothetical protein